LNILKDFSSPFILKNHAQKIFHKSEGVEHNLYK